MKHKHAVKLEKSKMDWAKIDKRSIDQGKLTKLPSNNDDETKHTCHL